MPGARRRLKLLRLARAIPRAILEAVGVRYKLAVLAANAAGQAALAAGRSPASLCVEPRARIALAIDRGAAMTGAPAVAGRCGEAAGRRHGHGQRWLRRAGRAVVLVLANLFRCGVPECPQTQMEPLAWYPATDLEQGSHPTGKRTYI